MDDETLWRVVLGDDGLSILVKAGPSFLEAIRSARKTSGYEFAENADGEVVENDPVLGDAMRYRVIKAS